MVGRQCRLLHRWVSKAGVDEADEVFIVPDWGMAKLADSNSSGQKNGEWLIT